MVELRPYQVEAVERIVDRGNLLLTMVMGSGKTAASVAAIRVLRRQGVVRHGAVFGPLSCLLQWEQEIKRWDPRARVQVIMGDKKERTRAFRRARKFNYNICSYGAFIHDWDLVKEFLPTDYLCLDEISAIKGFTAKRSKRAKLLGKQAKVRLGLSGAPVENRPEELYSILEFVDPSVLGSFDKFDRTFIVRDGWGRPKRYRNLHLIQQRLGPAMYRKSREDIKEWLPDKIEIEMPVVLDRTAMRLHELIRRDLSDAIDKALAGGVSGGTFDIAAHYGRYDSDSHTLMGQVMSRMLAMRMLSSHPRLLRISGDDFDNPLSQKGGQYASELKAAGLLDNLPLANAKLDALIETTVNILDEDPRHKVVVFSYFKPMLSMIGAQLKGLNIPYTLLTGDVTSAQERYRRIDRFNTDPKCRVFLSSDAGAYGVDLNQGSHLINYDLTWSSGVLAQRVSRIDRTSSAFDQIRIIYMYGHDTIEARMFRMLQQKMKVARAFIDGDFDARSGSLKLDLESLREFLDAA